MTEIKQTVEFQLMPYLTEEQIDDLALGRAWRAAEVVLTEEASLSVWRTFSDDVLGWGIEASWTTGYGEDTVRHTEFVHGKTFTEALETLTARLSEQPPS